MAVIFNSSCDIIARLSKRFISLTSISMSTHRPDLLSPIPELLREFEVSETGLDLEHPSSSNGADHCRVGIESMLDGLAELSRRLSLAPSSADLDDGLTFSRRLSLSLVPTSKGKQEATEKWRRSR